MIKTMPEETFVASFIFYKWETRETQLSNDSVPLSKITLHCFSVNSGTVVIPTPISPSTLISSIKASSTAARDVPLQLSADQPSPTKER